MTARVPSKPKSQSRISMSFSGLEQFLVIMKLPHFMTLAIYSFIIMASTSSTMSRLMFWFISRISRRNTCNVYRFLSLKIRYSQFAPSISAASWSWALIPASAAVKMMELKPVLCQMPDMM
ncbi:MAG: hypothetical protein HFH98_06130 [Lachnospiraceae bacterium]|nr:hypothetical protein [uncultured Acetatifactor sp.]MCI9230357.1 hypothetical protein [Lachnospiraceae bacterium]MCI9651433.1 hypothetical protein [Lachnospiraceae bacterium]